MGNEQQGGSRHHFIPTTANDENNQQEKPVPSWSKTGRPSVSKQSTKPSWQIARDVSMDILSRKATKLNVKQGSPPSFPSRRSIARKPSYRGIPTTPKTPQVYRTPRMPTEQEAADIGIAHQLSCSFCDGPCIGEYVRCRVCIKTCHSLCLFERGHVSDLTFSLRRLSKQDWSCPECSDITQLITHEELNHLIQAFEKIDRNKDGYIILEEFLSLQSNKSLEDGFELFVQHNYDFWKFYFSLMDSTQKGAVTWSDFVIFYSCKLIAEKNKNELTTKLSEKELVMAKNLFFKDPDKTFDNDYNIIITRDHFNRVSYDLIALLKTKYGDDFIDTILGYDDNNNKKFEGELSVMEWEEFLREISVLILLNRSNNDIESSAPRRAALPAHLLNATVVSCTSFSGTEIVPTIRVPYTKPNTPATPMLPNISCDESFRKHARILEKLNQRNRQEELKRKQMGLTMNCTIVENFDEQNNINLPKLKPNARDGRKIITDPWTSANEMQQLRRDPVLIRSTRIRTLKA